MFVKPIDPSHHSEPTEPKNKYQISITNPNLAKENIPDNSRIYISFFGDIPGQYGMLHIFII